jgi:hypothetical protein
MRRMLFRAGVVLAFVGAATTSYAQAPNDAPAPPEAAAPSPAPTAEQRSVAVFGDENPSCLQWNDGCFTCAKQPDGATACSTAGAACLPVAIQCTKKASDEERLHK